MAEGLILRVSHGGVNNTSVLLSDVEDGTNQPNTMPRPGGVYVPVGSFVDLVFTASVAISYESGCIRGFITSGHVTAHFVPGIEYTQPQRTGPWADQVYEDLRPVENHRATGAGAPDRAQVTEFFYAWAFSHTATERLTYVFHLPHNLSKGSRPTFHLHTTHNIASPTGTRVRWKTTWYYAKGYDVGSFQAVGTAISATQTVSARFVHNVFGEDPTGVADDFPCPLPFVVDLEPDGLVIVVVERDVLHGDDDFEHDMFVITADLHILVERDGTLERNRPFTSAGF